MILILVYFVRKYKPRRAFIDLEHEPPIIRNQPPFRNQYEELREPLLQDSLRQRRRLPRSRQRNRDLSPCVSADALRFPLPPLNVSFSDSSSDASFFAKLKRDKEKIEEELKYVTERTQELDSTLKTPTPPTASQFPSYLPTFSTFKPIPQEKKVQKKLDEEEEKKILKQRLEDAQKRLQQINLDYAF